MWGYHYPELERTTITGCIVGRGGVKRSDAGRVSSETLGVQERVHERTPRTGRIQGAGGGERRSRGERSNDYVI